MRANGTDVTFFIMRSVLMTTIGVTDCASALLPMVIASLAADGAGACVPLMPFFKMAYWA